MRRIKLYIILLGLTLFSCLEDNGNYNYKDINKITISGLKGSYSMIMGDEFTIEPVVEQTVPVDNLEYIWKLKDEVLSNDKILNVTLDVDNFEYGSNLMSLTIVDKSQGEDIIKSQAFDLVITSTMSYGYYFLTADENSESYLSYFSTKYVSKEDLYLPEAELIHTNYIEDAGGKKYYFGKNPKSITGFNYMAGANLYYFYLYILSEESEYPSIQTDNVYFRLNGYQNNEAFLESGYDFKPTSMLYTAGGVGPDRPFLFVSNNQLVMMHDYRLYRPAKHKKEYKWKNAYTYTQVPKLTFAFVHDELTDKIYYACPEIANVSEGTLGDSFTFDAIYDIKDSPSLSGKTVLGSTYTDYKTEVIINGEDGEKKEYITHLGIDLCLVSPLGLEFYQYYESQADIEEYPPHFDTQGIKTIATDLFSEDSKLIFTDTDWYVTSGNVIYTVIKNTGEIKTYATLPEECGEITSIKNSIRGKSFVITTYNPNSTSDNKGSIIFIDKESKKQFVYKDVIHRCVDSLPANAPGVNTGVGDDGDGR